MERTLIAALAVCCAGLASAVTLNWKVELTKTGGTNPDWCGIAVLAGAITVPPEGFTNGVADLLVFSGVTDNNYAAQNGYTLVAKVDMDGQGVFYAPLGDNRSHTYATDVGTHDTVTFVYFNQYHKTAELHVVSGLQAIADGGLYDLGVWSWPDPNTQTPGIDTETVLAAPPVVLPEPAALGVLAMGLACLTLRRRTR